MNRNEHTFHVVNKNAMICLPIAIFDTSGEQKCPILFTEGTGVPRKFGKFAKM